jgi:hypothetical protein
MKANELRIGNLVFADLYGEKPILVESICNINEDIFNSTTGEIPISSLKPIPLTEEWLLKFGFVKKNAAPSITRYFLNNFCVEFDPQDKYRFYCNGFYIEMHHVHQLQNIFYCLVGKELLLNNE